MDLWNQVFSTNRYIRQNKSVDYTIYAIVVVITKNRSLNIMIS